MGLRRIRVMDLEVVTIGTELVLGHTLDTNASYLARALAAVGARVARTTSVPDIPEAIRDAVAFYAGLMDACLRAYGWSADMGAPRDGD